MPNVVTTLGSDEMLSAGALDGDAEVDGGDDAGVVWRHWGRCNGDTGVDMSATLGPM